MMHKNSNTRKATHARQIIMMALLGVFLLPVALAWLILSQDWFTPGVRAHGEWVEGQIAEDNQWRLVLPVAGDCQACRQSGSLLENIDTALGRDSDRVSVVTLPSGPGLETGFVYIADPPGMLILRYPLSGDDGSDRMTGKALLDDLRRLLKYSRAG